MKPADILHDYNVEYEIYEHSPTFTAQQLAAIENVPGIQVAKPVIVKSGKKFYMCVIPACKMINFDSLRIQLNDEDLTLAEETEMAGLFLNCELGAEPPLGNLYGLDTIMDESLEADQSILFQCGSHETAIRMSMQTFKDMTHPRILNFTYPDNHSGKETLQDDYYYDPMIFDPFYYPW